MAENKSKYSFLWLLFGVGLLGLILFFVYYIYRKNQEQVSVDTSNGYKPPVSQPTKSGGGGSDVWGEVLSWVMKLLPKLIPGGKKNEEDSSKSNDPEKPNFDGVSNEELNNYLNENYDQQDLNQSEQSSWGNLWDSTSSSLGFGDLGGGEEGGGGGVPGYQGSNGLGNAIDDAASGVGRV